jgi:type VI secretion system secreted protein Hcp
MSVDMFLKLDGIKGEAQDGKYPDEIDVLSWSWGMSQSGTTHMGSGSGAGKVSVQDISITKYIDKSSPVLAQHCSSGKHIAKGTLIVRKAGENPLEYITINLKDIIVSSVALGGTASDDRLHETIALNFREFDYKYTTQTSKGAAGPQTEVKWDIAKNAAA